MEFNPDTFGDGAVQVGSVEPAGTFDPDSFGDGATKVEPSQEPRGPVDYVVDAFTSPDDLEKIEQSPEYKSGYESKKAELDTKVSAYDKKIALHKQASVRNDSQLRSDVESELEETILPTVISGKKYTQESSIGYYNKMYNEGQSKGLTNGESKAYAINSLKEQGATPLDIQHVVNGKRGLSDGRVNIDDIKDAATQVQKALDVGIAEPIKSVYKSFDMQASILASETGVSPNIFANIAKISELVKGNDAGRQAQDRRILDLAGQIKGARDSYKETYNVSSPIELGDYAPVAASALYNPTSLMALAVAPMPADFVLAKSQGFSTSQSVAQAMVVSHLTYAVGKIMKIGGELFTDGVHMKALGGSRTAFTSISEMPSKYKKQLRQIQRQHGYTDEELLEMINGFKNGTEDGKLNMMDVIRLTDQARGSQAGTGALDLVLHDKKGRELILQDISKRADYFLSGVSKDSELYKLARKNGTYLNSNGGTSLNWEQLLDDVHKEGIILSPKLRAELEFNANAFSDFDFGYHNVIKGQRVAKAKGIVDTIADVAPDTGTALFYKMYNKSTGMGVLPPTSVASNLLKVVNKAFDGTIDFVMRRATKKDVQKTIMESLEANTFNPSRLKMKLKQTMPDLPDDKIDDIVEETSKVDKAYKGARTEEEAEILYRDIQAEDKALEMERKQLEAEQKMLDADQNTEAEMTYRKIKDENADIKMKISEEAVDTKAKLPAAKVTYKARQTDLALARKEEARLRKSATQASDRRKAQQKVSDAEYEVDRAEAELKRTQRNSLLDAKRKAKKGTSANALAGGIAGVEEDDKGNLVYNPVKGIAGVAVGSVALKHFTKSATAGLKLAIKNEDFLIPEFIEAAANASTKMIDKSLTNWKIIEHVEDGVRIYNGKGTVKVFMEEAKRAKSGLALMADTTSLGRGNEGTKFYHALFDTANELGYDYRLWAPSDINKFRTTINELSYLKRGKSGDHIIIHQEQAGGKDLIDDRLTRANALRLARAFPEDLNKYITRWHPTLPRFSKLSTDAELEIIGAKLGADKRAGVGVKSLRMMRDILEGGL